jgi:hypothetical protein
VQWDSCCNGQNANKFKNIGTHVVQCSRLPAQLKTGDSTERMDAIIKNQRHYQGHQEHVWALVKFFWAPEQGQAS